MTWQDMSMELAEGHLERQAEICPPEAHLWLLAEPKPPTVSRLFRCLKCLETKTEPAYLKPWNRKLQIG